MSDRLHRGRHKDLTEAQKRALVILAAHGSAILRGSLWLTPQGARIKVAVINNLFDRELVRAAYTNHGRGRHTVYLNQVGRMVADAVKADVLASIAAELATDHATVRRAMFIGAIT